MCITCRWWSSEVAYYTNTFDHKYGNYLSNLFVLSVLAEIRIIIKKSPRNSCHNGCFGAKQQRKWIYRHKNGASKRSDFEIVLLIIQPLLWFWNNTTWRTYKSRERLLNMTVCRPCILFCVNHWWNVSNFRSWEMFLRDAWGLKEATGNIRQLEAWVRPELIVLPRVIDISQLSWENLDERTIKTIACQKKDMSKLSYFSAVFLFFKFITVSLNQ